MSTTTDDTRARALLEDLRDVPEAVLDALAIDARNALPALAFVRLQPPSALAKATIERDLEVLLALPVDVPPARDLRDKALRAWIRAAEKALGKLRAERVRLRAQAAGDPGRVADPVFARVGQERTKLDVVDDLVQFDWLDRARAAAAAVGYIEVARIVGGLLTAKAAGTVFLVAPRLVMTAYHVIAQRDIGQAAPTPGDLAAQVASAMVDFNYVAPVQAGVQRSHHTVARVVASDAVLDYAILELTTAPDGVAPLTLSLATPDEPKTGLTEIANIIQHPGKRPEAPDYVDDGRRSDPKKIGLRNNAIWKVEPDHLYYFTDTRGGSSGAPVFNDAWRVMALHTGWDAREAEDAIYLGRKFAFVNSGTRITAIIKHLAQHAPEVALTTA